MQDEEPDEEPDDESQSTADETGEIDVDVEKLRLLWSRAHRGKQGEAKRMLLGFLVTVSQRRERQERENRPVAKRLLKDLLDIQTLANRIHETLEQIDEARKARESAEAEPKGLLENIERLIRALVAPTETPIEDFAKNHRESLDSVLEPVFQESAAAIDALEGSFHAVSLRHPTEKRGLSYRAKIERDLGLTESEIALVEGVTVGAVHQALQRQRDAERESTRQEEGERPSPQEEGERPSPPGEESS